MDINELNKKQLILLTSLITFVVSIATGIITVSLMNQAPESVPQTINNVIQRTIEKVTTVQAPAPSVDKKETTTEEKTNNSNQLSISKNNNDALVYIYLSSTDTSALTSKNSSVEQTGTGTDSFATQPNNDLNANDISIVNKPEPVGEGIIISDAGLVLVDSDIIKKYESYKTVLGNIAFNLSVMKKYNNGFTILKIYPIENQNTDNQVGTGSQPVESSTN